MVNHAIIYIQVKKTDSGVIYIFMCVYVCAEIIIKEKESVYKGMRSILGSEAREGEKVM